MQLSADPYNQLVHSLGEIKETLVEFRAQAEEDKRLPQAVVETLCDAGFYRLFRPKALGGFELDAVTEFRAAEVFQAASFGFDRSATDASGRPR